MGMYKVDFVANITRTVFIQTTPVLDAQRSSRLSTGILVAQSSAATAISMMYLKVADSESPSEYLMVALFEILNKL